MAMLSDRLQGSAITNDSTPLKTKQKAVKINEIHTEIICTIFSDKTFIIITQYEKMGSLILVSNDQPEKEQSQSFSTKILLGEDDPMTHVIAKKIVSKYATSKPVLVSLALKDKSLPIVNVICDILDDLTMDKKTRDSA